LHRYLVGLVTLFVLATAGGVFYGRIQAERDALQSAADDASFGARLAATQLATGIATVRASVAQVAANPSIAQIFARPQACTLSFALSGAADAGHIDLLRPDGSVVCSSRSGSGAKDRGYAGADWMGHALRDPVFAAPVADPVTGKQVVLTTAPVPGLGVMAGFVDLSALGPALSNLLGGPRHLEFLVTSADGEIRSAERSGARGSRWSWREARRPAGCGGRSDGSSRIGRRLQRPGYGGRARVGGTAPG
jgi:hypothetical protein